MKTYALITPDDIRSYISTCFARHKGHRASYCGLIKQWIISRTNEVTIYHCFVFIQKFCSDILPSLTETEISVLLERMTGSVNDCLNYRLLPRTSEPGKRVGWRAQYNYQITVPDHFDPPVITQSVLKNLNPRCIYPRRVDTHFDRYEHAIRLDEFKQILIYGDFMTYIASHYVDGFYFTNPRPIVNLINERTETVIPHASSQIMNQNETVRESYPTEENKEEGELTGRNIEIVSHHTTSQKMDVTSTVKNTETVSHHTTSQKINETSTVQNTETVSHRTTPPNKYGTSTVQYTTPSKEIVDLESSKNNKPMSEPEKEKDSTADSPINKDITVLKENDTKTSTESDLKLKRKSDESVASSSPNQGSPWLKKTKKVDENKEDYPKKLTLNQMYKLVDCPIPKNVRGYKIVSSEVFQEGLEAVKKYLYNEASFRNVCIPSRKRVLRNQPYSTRQRIGDESDSDDYSSIDSEDSEFEEFITPADLGPDGKKLTQEQKNNIFIEKNIINFFVFVSYTHIIDMAFRTQKIKGADGPCLCPFNKKFSPLIKEVLHEDVRCAPIFDKGGCSGKGRIFKDHNSFLQHCETSRNWHHQMLAVYFMTIHNVFPKRRR